MTLNYKTAVASILQATHFLKSELDRLNSLTVEAPKKPARVLTPEAVAALKAEVDEPTDPRQVAVDSIMKPTPTPQGMPPAPTSEQMTKDAEKLMAELEARTKAPAPAHLQAQPKVSQGTVTNAKKGAKK